MYTKKLYIYIYTYTYEYIALCIYIQHIDFNELNSKLACHRIRDAPQARIVTGNTANWTYL